LHETVQPLGPILKEADAYFMAESKLHDTALALGRILSAEGVPYAIAGALALAVHGRVRMTEDIDVLIRKEDLVRFKRAWLGRGYVEIAAGLKAIRDTERGVRIDFLLAGEFPGDGKPKPVAFPDPKVEPVVGDELKVLSLGTLIELKIASGMTARHRAQDHVDVVALVRARNLGRDYATELDEYVREKYLELWELAQVRDDY
jgi:hypothetical protein